jgi:hypothetical protein
VSGQSAISRAGEVMILVPARTIGEFLLFDRIGNIMFWFGIIVAVLVTATLISFATKSPPPHCGACVCP